MGSTQTTEPDLHSLVYTTPELGWLSRAGLAAVALGLAACTVMLMSLSDLFSRDPEPTYDIRPVTTTVWRPPPPPERRPPVERPRTRPEEERRAEPKPEMRQRQERPQQQLRLPIRLDFTLQNPTGDFALDFTVDPTVEEIPEVAEASAPPPPPPEPEPDVYELSDLDREPVIVRQTRPVYPYRARSRGTEGHVDVQFTVTAAGTVADIDVVGAQPRGLFEQCTVRAVRRWRFEPGVRRGDPVPVRMQIRIRFALDR